MPRIAASAFQVPLTSLLLDSERDVTSVMRTFAASLSRYMIGTVRNSEAPTAAEVERITAWAQREIGAIFGTNAADVDTLFNVPGTVPNVVKLNIVKAAKAGTDPIVSRAVDELRGLGVNFSERSIVRGLSNPLPILSSREWVDPNGYKLSTRIWQAGDETFKQIDTIVRYEFSRGASVTRLSQQLEQFLTVEGAKTRTAKLAGRTGRVGSYATRRLVRTELSRAHGNAVMAAAHVDPFTAGIKWNLGILHSGLDDCDGNATANNYGLGAGIYPKDRVPSYPNHPHCLCYLSSVDANDRERIRYGARHNLIDLSGINSTEIVEQVTGFLNAA